MTHRDRRGNNWLESGTTEDDFAISRSKFPSNTNLPAAAAVVVAGDRLQRSPHSVSHGGHRWGMSMS